MATKKTTKKKNGPRTRRYGCITYRSEPQDNPDCRGRCSPPARMVSEDGRTKVTQIRYRRRNLDVVRKNCACDLTPSSKTKKTVKAPSKTAKAPSKTVKTVKKAPAKTAVKKTTVKTVKVPAKKTPAKKTAVKTIKAPAIKKTAAKTVSCGCAVTPAKTPSKPKTVTCGCAQTPAKVKEAILNKAEKEGMNRKELDRRIIVATVPKIEAKEPVKAPASWKVPTVGGRYEGKAEPIKAPASWKVPAVGGRYEGEAEPAKRTYTSRNPLILNINGEPYYVWEEFKGFKGSKENPDQMVVNARAILDFNRRQGFNSIQDVVDYINMYFVKPTPTPAKTAAKTPAKSTAKAASKEVTIRMSAPLSVQKRVLAKKAAMAKAKEVPDLLDPERPRPDIYGPAVAKEDLLDKVTFAHIYSLKDAERTDMPSKIYQVVEHNGKYYVMDGKQIASLKKDTKQEAFELAIRMAKTYKGRVMAQFKVPKSNPPRYRFKTI